MEESNRNSLLVCIPTMGIGGSSRVVFDLVSELARRGHDINLVIFFNHFEPQFDSLKTLPNVHIFFLGKRHHVDIPFLWRLRKLLRKLRPSVISSHLTSTFYLALVTNFKQTVIYHTIHANPSDDLPRPYRLFLSSKIRKKQVRLVGCSQSIASSASSLYRCFVPYITNGISLPKDALPVEPEFDFLSSGRLCKVKNFDDLINAFSIVIKFRPEAKLCICGDGEEKPSLIQQVHHLGLDSNVCFSPSISDMGSLYRRSKVFCLFSSREGGPLSIAEAMAYGLPIVGSDISGIKTYANDSLNGFLFPCHDVETAAAKMILLLTDKELRKTISVRNVQMAQNYSSQKMVDQYESLFFEKKNK
jgi:glycosyltransferase involved in cell wall biosynthesis